MRHLSAMVVVLTIAMASAAFNSAAAASPASSPCTPPRRAAVPVPYPAIQAWVAMHDWTVIDCLAAFVRRYNRRLPEGDALSLLDAILRGALLHDLDPLLVASVIAAESSFNPRARSHCGAEGLMQLTRPVQPWLGVTNPFNIKQNVAGGCRYLTYLRERFGRIDLVLAAYNSGPTRVARLRRVPNIPETVRYVRHVTRLHASLQASLKDRPFAVARGMERPFVFA